jgi:hypothetical protein
MGRTALHGLKFIVATAAVYGLVFLALVKVRIDGHPLLLRTNDYYQTKGGVSAMKFREWPSDSTYDAIVIGSSHAYKGYDPRVFNERGLRMFNLGTSAQTPLSSYALLEAHVKAGRTPLVVFDTYENAFDHPGVESVSDLTLNMPDDGAALRLALAFRDLRGLNMFTYRMLDRGAPMAWTLRDYVGRGAVMTPDSARVGVKYPRPRPFRMDARQLEKFLECLDLCTERGIRVVLSSHYYPHQGERARHRRFRYELDSVLVHRGVPAPPWIDLAEAQGIDDHDHFCDHNHLNAAGARRFTDQLIDSLEVRGLIERP